MKPCKTCKEFSCGANGSDYVSMKCGSEDGFIPVADDCLPNAAELVEFLRKESESMIVEYGSDGCMIVEYGSDGYRLKKAADAIEQMFGKIEQLEAENAQLKAERDAAIDDLQYDRSCVSCKYHYHGTATCSGCHIDKDRWEWRGVQNE